MTPYNTGKVAIGSNYDANPLKPKYVEFDGDMLKLQTALVGDVKQYRKNRLASRIYAGVVGLVLIFAYGLASAQAVWGPQGQYLGYVVTTPNGVTTSFTPSGQPIQSFQVDNGQTSFYGPQGRYQGTVTAPIYTVPNVTYTVPRQVPQAPVMRGW